MNRSTVSVSAVNEVENDVSESAVQSVSVLTRWMRALLSYLRVLFFVLPFVESVEMADSGEFVRTVLLHSFSPMEYVIHETPPRDNKEEVADNRVLV
jgi:hypothetical protein